MTTTQSLIGHVLAFFRKFLDKLIFENSKTSGDGLCQNPVQVGQCGFRVLENKFRDEVFLGLGELDVSFRLRGLPYNSWLSSHVRADDLHARGASLERGQLRASGAIGLC